jgi:spore coat protein JC
MIYKLAKDTTPEQLKEAGLGDYYVNHDAALFYHNAAGVPFTASYIKAKGDHPIADLMKTLRQKKKREITANV